MDDNLLRVAAAAVLGPMFWALVSALLEGPASRCAAAYRRRKKQADAADLKKSRRGQSFS